MAADQTCPVCRTSDIVCAKWTLLLVRDLAEGRSRFCELERSLSGISPRTLSLRLRALELEGIVERHTFPEVPPRVEYALTEKGRALLPIIDAMRAYGERWLRATGRPVVGRPEPVAGDAVLVGGAGSVA
jgi:DNA-binding HxlR family transcriptional regulator